MAAQREFAISVRDLVHIEGKAFRHPLMANRDRRPLSHDFRVLDKDYHYI